MEIELKNKLALVSNEGSFTYRELFGLSDLLAQNFPGGGAKIAIFSENSAFWLMALYGAWRAGNVPVPVDYLATAEELAYMLDDAAPALICCSDKTREVAEKACNMAKVDCRIFNLSAFKLPAEFPKAAEGLCRADDEDALLLYTSGTTGSPKGVPLTFRNIKSNIDAVCGRPIIAFNGETVMGVPIYDEDTRCLILLPLHHILPLLGTGVMPLYNGGTLYICPSLSGDDIRYIMNTYHITHMVGVPRLYSVICQGIKNIVMSKAPTRALYHLSRKVDSLKFSRTIFKAVQNKFGGALKYCVCGGAALDPETARDLRAFGFELLEGFGMTEASPMISFTRPGRTKIGTAGEIVPGVEVKTIDGELVARGANIMAGYYNRPEETAEIIKDGWLHTGDLGFVDEAGYVTITGRSKEIIVLPNGKNINPLEIEEKLESFTPFLAETAVLLHGGQLHAILVPNEKALAAAGIVNIEEAICSQIIDPYNRQASPAKRLMGYSICHLELPRTRMGKLRRFQLEEILNKTMAGERESENGDVENVSPAGQTLINYLTKITGIKVRLNHHLELNLGLDSLDKVTLLAFIEDTYGLKMSEQQLAEYAHIGDLLAFIEKNMTQLSAHEEDWHTLLQKGENLPMPRSSFMHSFLKSLAALTARICFRLKLSGQENLPQDPVIIAANHQSYADGLLLSMLMDRRTFKRTVIIAKEKHFNLKFLKFLARRCNIILMDINSNVKESMQKMAQALKKGYNVIIFPEGTRSSDGQVANFKRSFAIVSSELEVPVVPAVIDGASKAIPKGRILPRLFSKISVRFLPPVAGNEKDYQKLTHEVQEEIESALKKAA